MSLAASANAQSAKPAPKAAKATKAAKKPAAPAVQAGLEPKAVDILKAASARLAAAPSIDIAVGMLLRQMFRVHRTFIAATVVALALAGCAAHIARPSVGEEQRPTGFPDNFYQQLAQRGAVVLQIDPARSLVVIEVRRAGSLANLGHDHVVASHDVRGYVAPNDARADLYIRLDQLVVDEADLRAQAAFETQPSEAQIAGTRENMLGNFDAEHHPYAVISVKGIEADASVPGLNVSITLNGVTQAMRVPVKIEKAADRFTVTGRVAVAQTAFGIKPYSIIGGALQVQDQADVRFAIDARSMQP